MSRTSILGLAYLIMLPYSDPGQANRICRRRCCYALSVITYLMSIKTESVDTIELLECDKSRSFPSSYTRFVMAWRCVVCWNWTAPTCWRFSWRADRSDKKWQKTPWRRSGYERWYQLERLERDVRSCISRSLRLAMWPLLLPQWRPGYRRRQHGSVGERFLLVKWRINEMNRCDVQ